MFQSVPILSVMLFSFRISTMMDLSIYIHRESKLASLNNASILIWCCWPLEWHVHQNRDGHLFRRAGLWTLLAPPSSPVSRPNTQITQRGPILLPTASADALPSSPDPSPLSLCHPSPSEPSNPPSPTTTPLAAPSSPPVLGRGLRTRIPSVLLKDYVTHAVVSDSPSSS